MFVLEFTAGKVQRVQPGSRWKSCCASLAVTVVRSSIVYGPFSDSWPINIAQKLQSGNWGNFKKHADGICNLIYISDLVAGILTAARNSAAIGEIFNMSGPEIVSWNEYFRRFNAVSPEPVDFDEFSRNAVYVSDKAKDRLGFTPRFDLDTGLTITVSWLRYVGLAAGD